MIDDSKTQLSRRGLPKTTGLATLATGAGDAAITLSLIACAKSGEEANTGFGSPYNIMYS